MTLAGVSFLVGILLVGTAVLACALETREIRIPRVGPIARMVALLVGAVFLGIGLRSPELRVPLSAERDASAANHLVGPGAARPGDSTRRGAPAPNEQAPTTPAPRL